MENKNDTINWVASLLCYISIAVLGGGLSVAMQLADLDYNFNWMIFCGIMIVTVTIMGRLLTLSEILNKLHRIEINTRKKEETK